MVYISKVYTKFGDAGQTMLASGDTVSKATARVAAYGDVDELNSVLGMLREELVTEIEGPSALRSEFALGVHRSLARIQQELFNLGAELATPGKPDGPPKLRVDTRHVEKLEHEIDAHNETLEPLQSFILPGGGRCGAVAHLARTVCRRAERETVALMDLEFVRPEALCYINRLSDYLFVLARACAKHFNCSETLWEPEKT